MAVLQMERLHLLAMKRDRKKILELLQRRGIVEIQDAGQRDDVFDKMDTSATRTLLEKNAATAAQAVEILDAHVEAKKPFLNFLEGRKPVAAQVHDDFSERRNTVLRRAQQVVQHQRDIDEAKTEVLRAEALLEALVPWMDLPIPQNFAGTRKTVVFVGLLENELSRGEILEKLAAAAPELDAVDVEVVHSSKEQTCFYMVALRRDEAVAEEALRSLGFARPSSPSRHLPQEQKARLEKRIEDAEKQIKTAEEGIAKSVEHREDFLFLQDHMTMRAEKYGVIEKLSQTRHVFVLDGYIPARAGAALQEELETRFECSVQRQEAVRDNDDVPVLLKNNGFSRPSEVTVASYSLPGKDDVDPTTVMSFFYYIMFGLMFSDAAYGLLMAGVCGGLLLAKKNMEFNWKQNLKLFFWCGVSTLFWGVMFGSYFGDLLTVVSGGFFGNPIVVKPIWLDPLAQPMTLLMSCLAIGIIHLSFGMALKVATLVKSKAYVEILYDVVFPLLVVYPLIIILMGSDMFAGLAGFKLELSATVNTVCMVLAAIGVLGVLLFGGRESRNWVKRLLKGAYACYNVIAGWLGDILSYSRLLALGLATGVIASVVNSMGLMVGGGMGVVGLLPFVLIFLFGHALNFGINVLGAYVHSNRLEYVEFFGKFYEGGGRQFEPFGIHTKYYKIEEETQNV